MSDQAEAPIGKADELLRDVMFGIVTGRMDYAVLQAAGSYLSSIGIGPPRRSIDMPKIFIP